MPEAMVAAAGKPEIRRGGTGRQPWPGRTAHGRGPRRQSAGGPGRLAEGQHGGGGAELVRGPVADWSASKPRRPEVAGCGQTEEAVIRAATDERKDCSFGLSATSQPYFSLGTNQPPPNSQQYFSLRKRPAPATSHQPNEQVGD
jgi:hypothetical protein